MAATKAVRIAFMEISNEREQVRDCTVYIVAYLCDLVKVCACVAGIIADTFGTPAVTPYNACMTIYFAADHAGFILKEHLIAYVRDELGYGIEDLGAYEFNAGDDYPGIIARAAEVVAKDPAVSRAIILGGSGQGEAIVANRFAGVRAAVYYGGNLELVNLAREHNDANVLSLGARFVHEGEAREAVARFLATPFSGDERHVRRIAALDALPA